MCVRCRACATEVTKLDDPGIFDAMRKSIARRARNQKAPYHCIAAVEAACSMAFRRRLPARGRSVQGTGELRRSPCAALCVLHRARGGAAARSAGQYAGARLCHGRSGGRRHDGRRHRHELRRLRLSGEDHGRHAGGAGTRHAAHPRQLRHLGAPRLAGRGRDAAPARAHRTGCGTTTTSTIATSSSRRCSRRWTSRSRCSPSWTR